MPLDFISDVIYGLKIDQGESISIKIMAETSIDQATGVRSRTITSYDVAMALVLPDNQRLNFIRSFSGKSQKKEGAIEIQGRHFLIDKDDLPDIVITDTNTFILFNAKYYKVLAVEDYEKAWDLTAVAIPSLAP